MIYHPFSYPCIQQFGVFFSLFREERRDASKLYNKMEVKDLYTYDPATPWVEYINVMLDGVETVDENEIVIVDVPKYIEDFSQLMAVTPVRTQVRKLDLVGNGDNTSYRLFLYIYKKKRRGHEEARLGY